MTGSGCVGYQEKITTGWCADRKSVTDICDGSKEDCLAKGQALCDQDNDCHGVMYNPGWSNYSKGVMFCQSRNLVFKTDWQTFLKCPANVTSNFHYHIFLAAQQP